MKLVHQILQDVCLSSTRVALEFYHAARDAILLYEAVFPIKVCAWKELRKWHKMKIYLKAHLIMLLLERQLEGINQVAVLCIMIVFIYLKRYLGLHLSITRTSQFPLRNMQCLGIWLQDFI